MLLFAPTIVRLIRALHDAILYGQKMGSGVPGRTPDGKSRTRKQDEGEYGFAGVSSRRGGTLAGLATRAKLMLTRSFIEKSGWARRFPVFR